MFLTISRCKYEFCSKSSKGGHRCPRLQILHQLEKSALVNYYIYDLLKVKKAKIIWY